MENREKAEEGICIMSLDGGGPGSMSQLRILEEVMTRLAFKPDVEVDDLRPSDYFDLMGGVGFGGFVALLLGRLRMTISQAAEELATIGSVTFPEDDGMATPNVNMARLRKAIESMLERHGHSVDMKLRDNSDNRCKVVLFAATTTVMDHCHPFRTYRSPRKCLECTLVDAACATMATSDYFSSVAIGPRLREQSYAGIPHGFDNPMREVLKEAQLVFGDERPVSLVLSLGPGQRARLSDLDHHVTRLSRIHCDGVARDLQHQLCGFGEYLRLNVDKGMEKVELNDWSNLGSIEDHTEVYLGIKPIRKYIDRAVQLLLKRNGSVTLAQLSGTRNDSVVKFHSETLKDYLTMEFKQMHNIVQQLGIEKITLVDAIGNHIPIPTEFCLTYTMLSEVIGVYFRHQKAPGSDFVERGDYRLVHGSRRNIVGQMEWTRIKKVGLMVEMSMILRTRNENKVRCPRCRTQFEGRATDGWAQCLSCSGEFQIENMFQVEPQVEPDDQTSSQGEHRMESSPFTPTVRSESRSSEPLTREHAISGEAGTLQFRLISVINFDHPARFKLHLNAHSDVRPSLSSPILTSLSSNMGFTSTEAHELHPETAAPSHKPEVQGENAPVNVHTKTPSETATIWREDLKTLADRSGLKFRSEEHQDQQRTWWPFSYLPNSDSSEGGYLGSHSGKSKVDAKEQAAKQSYGTLTTLINTWMQNAAAASASASGSTYTDSGSFWPQELKRISKEKDLKLVCDQMQDSRGTWWATYHLINPDGSKYLQLGSGGAAASNMAMEHAAREAVETLNRWTVTWPQPGTTAGSSGAGGSSA